MAEDIGGMRIGVTGATGFVGRAVVEALDRRGAEAVALVRSTRRLDGAAAVRVVGDVDGATDWRGHVHDLDAVVHLAARVHVMDGNGKEQRAACHAVNAEGTRKLAEDCAAAGVRRLVLVSSVKVNGEQTLDRPFAETDAVAPTDPYASSKWQAEQHLRAICAASGLQGVIVRPVLVYGPGAGGNLARLMRLVRRGVPLPFAAVDNRRSLIGVANLADLLLCCAVSERAAGRLFLAADGDDLSTADLIRHLAAGLGVRPRLFSAPPGLLRGVAGVFGRSPDIDRLIGSLQVDTTAAREHLGWRPQVSTRAGLADMAARFASLR